MTRRAVSIWLAIGAAGYALFPWYALPDSVWALGWLRHVQGRDAAPAWLQVGAHGRAWLAPLGALLVAAAVALLPRLPRATRANALAATGALGFAYLFLQGFALGPAGWSSAWLTRVFGEVGAAQHGMGLGALVTGAAFLMLCALGLAGRGRFRGDGFIAGSVLALIALIATFTFLPVATILASAFEGDAGAFAPASFLARAFTERIWGLGCLGGAVHCGVAWNTLLLAMLCASGCTALGLAFALIAVRTRFRYRGLLRTLTVLPIIAPPFVIGLALILLLGRAGLVSQFVAWAFGLVPGRWLYGMPGVLLAQVFAFTPVAFLVRSRSRRSPSSC